MAHHPICRLSYFNILNKPWMNLQTESSAPEEVEIHHGIVPDKSRTSFNAGSQDFLSLIELFSHIWRKYFHLYELYIKNTIKGEYMAYHKRCFCLFVLSFKSSCGLLCVHIFRLRSCLGSTLAQMHVCKQLHKRGPCKGSSWTTVRCSSCSCNLLTTHTTQKKPFGFILYIVLLISHTGFWEEFGYC